MRTIRVTVTDDEGTVLDSVALEVEDNVVNIEFRPITTMLSKWRDMEVLSCRECKK